MVAGDAVTLKCNFKTDGRMREIVWYRVSCRSRPLHATARAEGRVPRAPLQTLAGLAMSSVLTQLCVVLCPLPKAFSKTALLSLFLCPQAVSCSGLLGVLNTPLGSGNPSSTKCENPVGPLVAV